MNRWINASLAATLVAGLAACAATAADPAPGAAAAATENAAMPCGAGGMMDHHAMHGMHAMHSVGMALAALDKPLSPEAVQKVLDAHFAAAPVKPGTVVAKDDKTLSFDVVARTDGAVVRQVTVDRATGAITPVGGMTGHHGMMGQHMKHLEAGLAPLAKPLTPDAVKTALEARFADHPATVGKVVARDDTTLVADVVSRADGRLLHQIAINRATGAVSPVWTK